MPKSLNIIRRLRVNLGGQDRFGPTPFSSLSQSYELSSQCVRYFYLASVVFIWVQVMGWHMMVLPDPALDRVWPIIWAENIPTLPFVDVISVACASFAILAFWKPEQIIFRVGFCITLLFFSAIPASMGAINHGLHEWFWISFILIFLPAVRERAGKLAYCLTFATAQALVLMFYTMAGFWKVFYGFLALLVGVPGNFSPDALSWTLADRMAQTGTQPLLGPFLVDNAILAWPMFVGLMFAQLVSIAVAFRPSLHALWAMILISFHTGTFLLMEISFPSHIVILVVLLLVSPFQRPDWLRPQTVLHLPIIGDALRLVVDRRKPAQEQALCPS